MKQMVTIISIAVATGAMATATNILSLPPGAPRDWVYLLAGGIVAACGAYINGLQRTPSDERAAREDEEKTP